VFVFFIRLSDVAFMLYFAVMCAFSSGSYHRGWWPVSPFPFNRGASVTLNNDLKKHCWLGPEVFPSPCRVLGSFCWSPLETYSWARLHPKDQGFGGWGHASGHGLMFGYFSMFFSLLNRMMRRFSRKKTLLNIYGIDDLSIIFGTVT